MADVEKYVSSTHIQKLGHSLREIRERALKNLISKLEHGFIYDNDLARSKEILQKLFEWFLFEQCSHEDVVLRLIKRILQTESGSVLLKHYGPKPIIAELTQIKSYIENKYHPVVDDIVEFVKQECTTRTIVPPLQSDVPLSYRSCEESNRPITIETTATPIEGFVQAGSSLEQQTGVEKNDLASDNLSHCSLPWQPLVTPDRHVLESVEDSLRNPPQPSALLHSCEFFIDIMVHDFPAEVFLQRPGIVLMFQKLMTDTSSTRVGTAIIKCLLRLTELLETRVNYYSDPGTHNLKQNSKSEMYSTISPSPIESYTACSELETSEDSALLQAKQISLLHYCFSTMKCVLDYLYNKPESFNENITKRRSQVGINNALLLVTKLIRLLNLCNFNNNIQKTASVDDDVRQVLIKFGEIIDGLRVAILSNNYEKSYRIVHLHLLCSCAHFLQQVVPPDKSLILLPRNLKQALSSATLDVTFSSLYPKIHEKLLAFTQDFDSVSKYNTINDLRKSMTASIRLLRRYKSLPTLECISLMKDSVQSLEFHKNLSQVKIFVDFCANKLPLHAIKDDVLKTVEDITLNLLAHNDPDVRLEMYRLCYQKVINAIGPKLNVSRTGAPGSQILFLIRAQILTEMAIYGVTSDNVELQTSAEDILTHILKCKILVSDDIWNIIVETLIPSLPVLLSHADSYSALGRTIASMLDPDRATSLNLPTLEVVKGNIVLMFNNDSLLREEGVSRLCWLLSSDDSARELLPRLSNLHDKALSAVCKIERLFDVNKTRTPQQFYQPNSLYQVLQLMNSANIEPVIRRSALTQIAVMMEDPLIHSTFVQNGGIQIVTAVMKSALKETNYVDYPDSILPCVSILKNVCLYNASIRHELSTNADVFCLTIRGMFLFCTDTRMTQDGSILLFLLLFNHYIIGTPAKSDLAIPKLIQQKLCVPFLCKLHSDVSKYAPRNLTASIIEDEWALASLQIHWTAEWFGGINELLSWDEINYGEECNNELLRMREAQLLVVKRSSLEFCLNKYLKNVQNATEHENIVDSVNRLTAYLEFYRIIKDEFAFENDFLALPWKETFERFLIAPPSNDKDAELLTCIVSFLQILLFFYKHSALVDDPCWIVDILKDKTNPLLEVLRVDTTSHDALNKELLLLIENCARHEQLYFDFHPLPTRNSSWSHVVEIIAENLKISDTQHFYNLAYLDCLLSCLVHLTATLGWSQNKSNSILMQLVTSLCEMIDAFHSSKGPSAADSMMGLSITRNAVLILNHLLVEMQHFNLKSWDTCFLSEETGLENSTSNLFVLCASRDVVLRAAVYQLFSGLVVSNRCASELVKGHHSGEFWQNCLNILVQFEEANIVRENVAILLANICSHTVATTTNDNCLLDLCVAPTNINNKEVDGNSVHSVIKILDNANFFKELKMILSCLYLSTSTFHFFSGKDNVIRSSSLSEDENLYAYVDRSSSSRSSTSIITTPSFVKALTFFVCNLLLLAPNKIAARLHEDDLIKSFFKCLCIPELVLASTKDVALYCDVLEMNAGICSVLTKSVTAHAPCLGIVLNAHDCLRVLFGLLNPSNYCTSLPQLVYLRNKLWSEVFNLIGVLLGCDSTNGCRLSFKTISSALSECGRVPFLQTLCEAISCHNSTDLQHSALTSLTSLLQTQPQSPPNDAKSIQDLLDKTLTPRLSSMENGGTCPRKSGGERNLENTYLKQLRDSIPDADSKSSSTPSENNELMAGAAICEILLSLLEAVSVKPDAHRGKALIINSLTGVLCVSHEAKKYAADNGLLLNIMQQLREFHLKLSLDSVESLRRVSDRKRLNPVLKEIGALLGLLTNFMFGNCRVKNCAASTGLADLIHKLWAWFLAQKELLVDALKLLCTYTTDCLIACQSLPLTSAVAGSGPRKTPSNVSLLHAIVALISKEMDQISRSHDLLVLQLCFHALENSCNSVECRIILSKTNFLHYLTRLHPAITKKQKPWECVELIWMQFLQAFTVHPEGQACVAKISDVLELVIILTNSMKRTNRHAAMIVLRNISFYQSNRPRLLTSPEFLNTLEAKLTSGSLEEKNLVVLIMWALSANNQKAKLVLKCAGLDRKLQESLKLIRLSPDVDVKREDLDRMHYVLNLLKDGEKCK